MRHKPEDSDLMDAIYRRGSRYHIYKLVIRIKYKVVDHCSVNYERMRFLTSASFTPITHAQFPVSGYTYVLLIFNRVWSTCRESDARVSKKTFWMSYSYNNDDTCFILMRYSSSCRGQVRLKHSERLKLGSWIPLGGLCKSYTIRASNLSMSSGINGLGSSGPMKW